MITVYVWTPGNGPGHASMKLTRTVHTRYYSWWPPGAASLVNPRGTADSTSSGAGHPRRNPAGYGQSKLDPAAPQFERGVTGGAHNPGGQYVYNKSDKQMEAEDGGVASSDYKFFFRPASGLKAGLAEQVWARRLNALATNKKARYHFVKDNCSTTVIESLVAAISDLPKKSGGVKRPPAPRGICTPDTVFDFCESLGKYLNNDMLRWSNDLPPVVGCLGKGEGAERYVNPIDGEVLQFSQAARHEAHTD